VTEHVTPLHSEQRQFYVASIAGRSPEIHRNTLTARMVANPDIVRSLRSPHCSQCLPVESIDSHEPTRTVTSRCVESGVPYQDVSAFNEAMASSF
jgi:hypothetical protein